MTYVISDIHGEFYLFMEMLNKIKFSDDDTLFIIGDVIDRGKHSFDIVQYVMNSDNIEYLMGNHELMMLEAFKTGDRSLWYQNGGNKTVSSSMRFDKDDRNKMIRYISTLNNYYILEKEDTNIVLVHAGIQFDSNDEIVEDLDFMMWSRIEFYGEDCVPKDYLVIFGHTPTRHLCSKDKIWHGNRMIGIDCGAVYTGILGCLRLDDMKEFYVRR